MENVRQNWNFVCTPNSHILILMLHSNSKTHKTTTRYGVFKMGKRGLTALLQVYSGVYVILVNILI